MSQPLYEDYYFAVNKDPNKLEEEINSRLAAGYVPCGGVCVVYDGSRAAYAQAVAKPVSATSQLQQELKEQQ